MCLDAHGNASALVERNVETEGERVQLTFFKGPPASSARARINVIMRRILKPEDQLLFVEHGRASEDRVVKWQDRLTPLWKAIGGGCHLNRPITTLIESAGFRIAELNKGYMRGPKPMTFMYEGRATRA